MSQQILGRAKIRVNDAFYDSEPGALLEVGGTKNNTRMTSHSVKYNQSLIPARVTCSVPLSEGTSLRALQEIADAEIHFEADTGQTFIIRNAFQVLAVAVSDGEQGGMVALEFNGSPAEEMLA
jgi:hypothetical protein